MMRKLLFITLTLALFTAATADAGCIRCDQWTGYQCYMSVYGTKAFCDSPSNAGCITWGYCSPGAGCNDDWCIQYIAAIRFTREMRVASVSITVPLGSKLHS
jgi:hypothetical protein